MLTEGVPDDLHPAHLLLMTRIARRPVVGRLGGTSDAGMGALQERLAATQHHRHLWDINSVGEVSLGNAPLPRRGPLRFGNASMAERHLRAAVPNARPARRSPRRGSGWLTARTVHDAPRSARARRRRTSRPVG
ncbi:hypothetical protein ACRAWF_47125 [Streptomyces sp. L7]